MRSGQELYPTCCTAPRHRLGRHGLQWCAKDQLIGALCTSAIHWVSLVTPQS